MYDLAYLDLPQQQLSPYSSATSEATLLGDHTKHQNPLPNATSQEGHREGLARRLEADPQLKGLADGFSKKTDEKSMATTENAVTTVSADANAAASRPKRVRTGCLTCRERHLKCDEGLPDCVNCRKSSRLCKRGVRLNFIDTQVKTPPITPPTLDWDVTFHDESREIASEYKGGLDRYAALKREPADTAEVKHEPHFDFSAGAVETPVLSHQQLPTAHSLPPGGVEAYPGHPQRPSDQARDLHHRHASTNTESTFSSQTVVQPSHNSYTNSEQTLTPPSETRSSINSPEELLFMQVFVEEVGLWMDSMDPYKHVSCAMH